MTRTHDSSDAPRYVNRDRHLNRSGVDGDLKKGGQGAHNWGNSELDPEYINDQQAKEIGEEDNLMEQEKKAPTGPTTINLGDLPIKQEKKKQEPSTELSSTMGSTGASASN